VTWSPTVTSIAASISCIAADITAVSKGTRSLNQPRIPASPPAPPSTSDPEKGYEKRGQQGLTPSAQEGGSYKLVCRAHMLKLVKPESNVRGR
jgi:hypothetical protein